MMNDMPTKRGDLAAAAVGDRIYVLGGRNDGTSENGPVLDTHEAIDLACTNNPPDIPTNPDPIPGTINHLLDLSVSWSADDPDPGDTLTYDVYFGPSLTPPLASSDQTATLYDPPGLLEPETWYYWRVVAKDNNGAVTTSPRWGFQTGGPAITVNKVANTTEVPEPGDTVSFTVQVVNNLSGAITLNSLVDDIHGDLDGEGSCSLAQTINVGESYTCVFNADVTGNAGDTEMNIVTANASDSELVTIEETDSFTVTVTDVLPSISINKTVDPAFLPEPGGMVTYTVEVDNLSVEAVTLDSLIDDVYGNLDNQGDCAVNGSIPLGGSYSCSFTASFSGEVGDSETNTVTATASDDEGNDAVDDDSATVTITDTAPSLSITAHADPLGVPEPGGPLTFTVGVTNTSVEPVSLLALVDEMHGNLDGIGTCNSGELIASGASYQCAFSAQVSGPIGEYTDVFTATVEDNDDNTISAMTSAGFTIEDVPPGIEVSKTPHTSTLFVPGEYVTYTVTLTNTSVETITLTTLIDALHGDLNEQGTCETGGVIPIGGGYTCAYTGWVGGQPGAELDIELTATATDNEFNTAMGADSVHIAFYSDAFYLPVLP
jgi:uncharacterized repeat protein (TIGR01451 family)